MWKIILTALIICLAINNADSQKRGKDIERIAKLKIKSQTAYIIKYENDSPAGDSSIFMRVCFNRFGQTASIEYYENEKIDFTSVLFYHNGNVLDSSISTSYDSNSIKLQTTFEKYDSSGRLRESLSKYGDGRVEDRTHYVYVENPAMQISIREEPHLRVDTTYYIHDDRWNVIKEVTKTKDGDTTKQITRSFDADGNMTMLNEYYVDRSFNSSYVFDFDKNGFRHEAINFDYTKSLLSTCIYDTDEMGNIIDYDEYNKEGKLTNKYKIYYEYFR